MKIKSNWYYSFYFQNKNIFEWKTYKWVHNGADTFSLVTIHSNCYQFRYNEV